MKLVKLVLGGVLLLSGAVQAQDEIDGEKLSYALGYRFGLDVRNQEDLNIDTVIRALQDAVAKRDPAVPVEELEATMLAARQKFQAEQLERFKQIADENKAKTESFLADHKTKKGVVVLPSGVQYRIIDEGSGPRPRLDSEVKVHYRSSTMGGREFDSTFIRGEPVEFQVNQVLKGWQEVLPLMKAGATWRVVVPPELAYGVRGQPPVVGPNEALVFDLNLVEIKS